MKEHIRKIISGLDIITTDAVLSAYAGRRPPTKREVQGMLKQLGYNSDNGIWK